ncbi:PREDICTED: 60S ribosomal protein L18a-like protein isoform X2 [Ipomoea nil]|uniref:60S ribosomal protein L18a-like protein isoform X2 n=1 Tax=Ipomoea nil TaxID=35883 RepID=UPI0009015039|nr:PREDICTED: 60S ribosomal protein L18a-like protein isoform X2 [Ipomoea nil]
MGKRDEESSHHRHAAHDGGNLEAPPLLQAAVPAYDAAEKPVREDRLPCCGCGSGWFMFLIGFFLATIPWYIAAFILICGEVRRRERPGYIACTIAALCVTVVFTYVLCRLLPHLIPLIMSLFGI